MTLNLDNDAINKRLRIIPDEPQDSSMSWLQDMPKEFSKPHKRVEPFPGACIKTWTESGDKLFLNICHSKEIVPPEDITDEAFGKMMMDEVPAFVIPMAIGVEKMAKDKEDVERPTFDILINSNYFEKCMQKPHFWQFTIAATLQSINDKYNKSINTSKYVVLKNRKVIGSLDTFTIEDRAPRKPVIKKPLIEEIGSKESKRFETNKKSDKSKPKIVEMKTNQENMNDKQHTKLENYVLFKTSDQEHIIGYFYLPLSSITDITVDVGENRLILENQKADSAINIFLPCSIDNNCVTANYDSKLHVLKLKMPLKANGLT